MKKVFLPLLILFPIISYSQELDKAFLDSLPQDVRQDIENKIDSKEDLEKKILL